MRVPEYTILEAKTLEKTSARTRTFRLMAVVICLTLLLGGYNIGVDASPNDASSGGSRPLLLFLGDSLTERGERSLNNGWITQLRTKYNGTLDIISRGFSGYNSRWYVEHILPTIEQDLAVFPVPALVTVWLGANDAVLLEGPVARQNVPVEEYGNNLLAIIGRLKAKAPSTHIVLITPPPINESERLLRNKGTLDRSNEHTGLYAAMCIRQAQIASLPVLDLYSYFSSMNEIDRNGYFFDGLHFNEAGNTVVREQLMALISTSFPILADAIDTFPVPTWRTLAYGTVQTSGSS